VICLFLKSTLIYCLLPWFIVFYHGYSRKSDLVATGSSLRHSGDQDVDSDISWTLGSQSVEVKHDHLCIVSAHQGSSHSFSRVRHPCWFQDSLLRAMQRHTDNSNIPWLSFCLCIVCLSPDYVKASDVNLRIIK